MHIQVGQTQRYSSLLAQRLAGAGPVTDPHQPRRLEGAERQQLGSLVEGDEDMGSEDDSPETTANALQVGLFSA